MQNILPVVWWFLKQIHYIVFTEDKVWIVSQNVLGNSDARMILNIWEKIHKKHQERPKWGRSGWVSGGRLPINIVNEAGGRGDGLRLTRFVILSILKYWIILNILYKVGCNGNIACVQLPEDLGKLLLSKSWPWVSWRLYGIMGLTTITSCFQATRKLTSSGHACRTKWSIPQKKNVYIQALLTP